MSSLYVARNPRVAARSLDGLQRVTHFDLDGLFGALALRINLLAFDECVAKLRLRCAIAQRQADIDAHAVEDRGVKVAEAQKARPPLTCRATRSFFKPNGSRSSAGFTPGWSGKGWLVLERITEVASTSKNSWA